MTTLENKYPHLTAKERTAISFPSKYLYDQGYLKGRVLDYGCGFGKDVEVLAQRGIDIQGFDPHYFPDQPVGKFETIICQYVLNVLKPEEQALVLMRVSALLQEGGTAYFTVRRDITYEGFRMHRLHKKPTFQMQVRLPYESVYVNDHCEIYRYRRIVDRVETGSCIFCAPVQAAFLCESATAYALLDKFPVSEGHALIIPKRHESNYFLLTEREQRACWMVVNEVQRLLKERTGCEAFNVGINIGAAAGQTVPHSHIHVIPRYPGDHPNPTGGVRAVIPGKADYLEELIKK